MEEAFHKALICEEDFNKDGSKDMQGADMSRGLQVGSVKQVTVNV